MSPAPVSRVLAPALALLVAAAGPLRAQVERIRVESGERYLVLEALDDDLLHFELAAGPAPPAPPAPLPVSPMVLRTDHAGPRVFDSTAVSLETAELRVAVDRASLCFTATDRARGVVLTTLCPADLEGDTVSLTLARGRARNAYGLGEQFVEPGESDGDWAGRLRTAGDEYGNRMVGFNGGAVGNAMFPVLYAVGDRGFAYALFLDHLHSMRWDLRGDPWRVSARGGPLRGYLISGPGLPDLRSDYLELTGRPPVPPRKAFGLWVSEYGFDGWEEQDAKLASLRAAGFPIDGFVMDLQWFGGIASGSDSTSMGRLDWDRARFPDPEGRIARLREREGLGLVLIEEAYVGRALPEHDTLAARGYLVRRGPGGPPAYLEENPWWGKGGMIDWTHEEGAAFWHDRKRQPLVEMGVLGHWTDLGEPEIYDPSSWYDGVEPGEHDHGDVHNAYNLEWSRSIFDGYRRHGVRRRPWILSRSGTSGSQRFGVGMWSGDIGANLSSLATHFNAQMHMSMSGVDYFGSDIGGFHRAAVEGDPDEMYTQWFAAGALLDVPVRPHTENLCNCKETAPDRIGHVPSNLANLRLRYRLIPYLYSLAHRAWRHGEPVFAPLVFWHPDDPRARTLGDHKLIGRDLLLAVVARHGAERRDVYLPRGRWIDFHSNRWINSGGEWVRGVPLRRDGLFRLPLYARAGAILPLMRVDGTTRNLEGPLRELVVRAYPTAEPTSFVLFEDDGETVAYQEGEVAATEISQRVASGVAVVTVGATRGSYAGAPERRAAVVELVPESGRVTAVRLDGRELPRLPSRAALEEAESGWTDAGDGVVAAKGPEAPVGEPRRFEFVLGEG